MSSSDLNEVVQCCQAILTDKKGVKRALDTLECLLKNPNVLKALNANTDECDEVPNWNTVFSPLLEHVFKDEEALMKVLPAGGTNLKKNLTKYKSTCNYIKNILQIANKTSPRLKIDDFLNHAISVLKKTRLCHHVGLIFFKIIAEDVFCHRKYVCQLSLRQYSDLIVICFQGAKDESMKNHLQSISSLLCLIINSLRMQHDSADFTELFESYTCLLNNMSSDTCRSCPHVLENVMKSMISFVEWSSVSFRMQSCKLGESCLDNLLSLWMATGHTLTEISVEKIIEFSNLQIQLHNPAGKTDPSQGAFSTDSEKWTRLLLKMLSACEIHLKKFANRLKYASKAGKSANFDACLELSAEACNVLFRLRARNTLGASETNNVNRIAENISTAVESNTDYLSGKIDFCDISSVLRNLPKDRRRVYILQLYAWMYEAWLNILLRLFSKIADDLSPYTISSLIAEIYDVYQVSHKNEITYLTLDCVSALFEIRCNQFSTTETPSSGQDVLDSWRTWWTIGNSYLNHGSKPDVLHHAFRLLGSLVQFDKASSQNLIFKTGCMKNTRNLWTTLFTHVVPSSDSLQFVTAYVDAYGHEHNSSDDEVFLSMLESHYHHHSNKKFVNDSINKKYPFCSFVLHWLFGCKEEIVIENAKVNSYDRCCGFGCPSNDPTAIAKLNFFSLDDNQTLSKSAEASSMYDLVYFLLLLCQKKLPNEEDAQDEQKIEFFTPKRLQTIDSPDTSKWFDVSYVSAVQCFQIAEDNSPSDTYRKLLFVHEIGHLVSAFLIYNIKSMIFEIKEKKNEYKANRLVELIRRCFLIANVHGRFRFHYKWLFERYSFSARFVQGHDDAAQAVKEFIDAQKQKLSSSDSVVDSFPDMFFLVTDSIRTLCHYFRNISHSNLPKFSPDYKIALNVFGEIATSYVESFIQRTNKKHEEEGEGFSDTGDNYFQCTQEAEPGLKRRRYSGIGALSGSTSEKDNHSKLAPVVKADDRNECDCGKDPHHFLCNANLTLSNAINYISFISIQHNIKDHFVKCISIITKHCDISNAFHLQVFHSLLGKVSDTCKDLDLSAISQVIEMLKSVFKNFYQDQQVCSDFLVSLSTLLTNVAEKECPEEVKNLLTSTATKIIGVYWRLSLQNKSAPCVRAAMVHCLFAIFISRLQSGVPFDPTRTVQSCTRLKLLDFLLNCDILAGMLSFLNDRHSGVQLLCAGIVKDLFSEKRLHGAIKKFKDSSSESDEAFGSNKEGEISKWRKMQHTVVSCISEFVKVFFQQRATLSDRTEVQVSPLEDAEQYTSTLSAYLHAVSNAIPYRGHQTEKEALNVFCLLASLTCKNAPPQCKGMIMKLLCSCVDRISSNCAKTGFDLEPQNEYHKDTGVRYLEFHLESVFRNWFKDRPGQMMQAITEFPYMLFKCINIKDFCTRYKSTLFPVLFCNACDIEELRLTINSCFAYDGNTTVAVNSIIKEMVKSCAPNIVSLMLTMIKDKNGNLEEMQKRSLMLDSIMETGNTLHRLCQGNFSQIAASVFLHAEALSDKEVFGFDQQITQLHSWYFSRAEQVNENTFQAYPAHEKLLSVLFGDKRNFENLIYLVLCFRRHLAESKNVFDLNKALRMLPRFMKILASSKKHAVPSTCEAYIFHDIVHLVSYYVSFLCKKKNVLPQYCDKGILHDCLLTCVSTLAKVVNLIKSTAQAFSAEENWNTLAPFMNTVANIMLVIAKEREYYIKPYTKRKMDKSFKNLDSMFDLLCTFVQQQLHSDLFLFLPFPSTSLTTIQESVDLTLCLKVFKTFMKTVDIFGTNDHNQLILGQVIKKFSESLRSSITSSEGNNSMEPEDAKSSMRLLFKLSSSKNFNTDEVASCISHLCTVMSKDSISIDSHETRMPNMENDFMSTVFKILIQQITDFNPVYSSEAVQCLYQLCELPLFLQYWQQNVNREIFHQHFVSPFFSTVKSNPRCKTIPESKLRATSMPEADCYSKYDKWICEFASHLCELCSNRLFLILQSICLHSPSLCEVLLPHIFHDILKNDTIGEQSASLTRYVRDIFYLTLSRFEAGKSPNILILQTVLHVVQFLRCQSRTGKSWDRIKRARNGMTTSWDNNFWLDLDYLQAAEIAVRCRQPYMAILFAEIWNNCLQNSDNNGSGMSDARSFQETKLKEILLLSFTAINEIDSLHGLCSSSMVDDDVMAAIYKKEDNWNELVYFYNAKASRQSTVSGEVLRALHFSGLEHIAATYRKGVLSDVNLSGWGGEAETNGWLAEVHYEAAWKAAQWDDDPSKQFTHTDQKSGFHKKVFECLAGVSSSDRFVDRHLALLRKQIISSLQDNLNHLILDHSILPELAKLMALEQIKAMHEAISQNDSQSITAGINATLKSWQRVPLERKSLFKGRYDCSELLLSVRNSLFSAVIKQVSEGGEFLSRKQENTLEKQSQLLTESKQYKVASQIHSKLKSRLQSRCDSDESARYTYMKISMEDARIQWLSGNQSRALRMVKDVCEKLRVMNKSDNGLMQYLYAKALHTQGQWLHESKMEGPSAILENYLSKAVEIVEKMAGLNNTSDYVHSVVHSLCIEGFESLAKFADLQYQEVVQYMKSSEFARKTQLMSEARAELKIAQKTSSSARNKYKILLQKNYEIDESDFTNILNRKEGFLKSALKAYIKCLTVCDCNELLMYRICSLWFANVNNEAVCKLMEGACKSIGSHNFVQSAYQLAARLTSNTKESRFQAILMKLLCRVAKDHPYHVLDIILALVNAHEDQKYTSEKGKSAKSQELNANASGQVEAAKKVWNEVKKSKTKLMCCMEILSSSCIQLANYQVNPKDKSSGVAIDIHRSLEIKKLCDNTYVSRNGFGEVPIPTVSIPVDKGCKYETGVVTLKNFKPFFKLCGGINVPKILVAVGSDGRERKHLVKGKDDLRQDAVMEQVFQVVNTLLHKEEDSQDLCMKTYKIVPLSQHSGLVEWCENTIPIGTYLTGTPPKDCGAHHRFRPQDLLPIDCRKKLGGASRETFQKKCVVYKEICMKFRPVLKHFFYENFLDPTDWFKRRMAYSKSAATSSMVTYVLGLGDRHVQNILLDCNTAELIHIDLGVAFEQGHCLPTPEKVPFRLTRDIVDGFGVTGVEGTFRRNCERTLTVLRNSIEIISTIIEVLLHDPLHDWMMTPKKAMTLQRPSETNQESVCSSIMNVSTAAELLEETTVVHVTTKTNRSSLAERALLRVQEKLRGLEFSTVLSVKGQVNLLIQQATDPEKLCLMFAGWQPYL